MSSLEPVRKEFERVAKKQKTLAKKTISTLDAALSSLEATRELLSQSQPPANSEDGDTIMESDDAVAEQMDRLVSVLDKADVSSLANDHKDLHTLVSKFGKSIDKNMHTDLENAYRNVELDSDILDEAIALHFFRQGNFELGRHFLEEVGKSIPEEFQLPFVELYNVLAALEKEDLEVPLKWCEEHKDFLNKKGSSLEFRLHRLQFLRHLTKGNPSGALAYARKNFSPFAESEIKEIQRLMASFLYVGRLSSSPYSDLLNDSHWTEVKTLFIRECCSISGLPQQSPLLVCVNAGMKALPTLLKLAVVMQGKRAELTNGGSLPVEVELGPDFQFHSIFACPVSKEQSTPENPPMLMPCGHVISSTSLSKLSRSSMKFKCPYCPTEQTISQSRIIHF